MKKPIYEGKISISSKGFGFVLVEQDPPLDIYVPKEQMRGAWHGDIVKVEVLKTKDGKQEGRVVEIVEKQFPTLIGEYKWKNGYSVVVPDDSKYPHVLIREEDDYIKAVEGHKVIVTLNEPSRAFGIVTKVIGHKNDPGVDILSILHAHALPEHFPEEVVGEADRIKEEIPKKEIENRKDLRNELILTIDGADAKDLDDAVTLEKLENGNYRLGVHIADVSHYVKANGILDKEAYERGTSVYLVDRVIPMIPHRLSNGVCSLHPGVDRLTLSCEMEIDDTGKVVSSEIFESVIHSKKRLTYQEVKEMLVDGNTEVQEKYSDVYPMLQDMEQLARILQKKREKRGSIDFDIPESKILVDDKCVPHTIEVKRRSIAEKLIEEFMLIANETVAERISERTEKGMYRIHEEPGEEKVYRFATFVSSMGYPLQLKNNDLSYALQDILQKVKGQAEEKAVRTMMLRSMQQAKYSENNTGHFGLGAAFYTHFTSPIRRYPDLIVHRLIKAFVLEKNENVSPFELHDIAHQTSKKERVAVEAERETVALKKAEYMNAFVGEEYEATISSITKFGLFVELENTVDGLIRIRSLHDDHYEYDDQLHILKGQRHGRVYKIGEKVEVKLDSVDIEKRTIDFVLKQKKKPFKKQSRKEKFANQYRK